MLAGCFRTSGPNSDPDNMDSQQHDLVKNVLDGGWPTLLVLGKTGDSPQFHQTIKPKGRATAPVLTRSILRQLFLALSINDVLKRFHAPEGNCSFRSIGEPNLAFLLHEGNQLIPCPGRFDQLRTDSLV